MFYYLLLLPLALANRSIEILTTYGYVDEHSLMDGIEQAVLSFQETYSLEPTVILDNATLELLYSPRCGNKDQIRPLNAVPDRKFKSTVITWKFFGNPRNISLIERAFDLWEQHTNLNFKRVSMTPVIYILFSQQRHLVCYFMRSNCAWAFDGPGSALAHAFLPDPNFNQTDIHFDSEEIWDYNMGILVYKDISFVVTLVHEIGHALGLDNLSIKGDVMYAYYGIPSNIHNLTEYQLSSNDRK